MYDLVGRITLEIVKMHGNALPFGKGCNHASDEGFVRCVVGVAGCDAVAFDRSVLEGDLCFLACCLTRFPRVAMHVGAAGERDPQKPRL